MKITAKRFFYFLLSLFFLLGLGVFTLYSARKPFAAWAIHYFLESKNVSSSFTIESLDMNEVKIKNIVINEHLKIPLIYIERDPNASMFWTLKNVTITISNLDIPTMQQLYSAAFSYFPAPPESSTPIPHTTFSNLMDGCQWLQKSRLHLSVDTLNFRNASLPLHFALHFEPRDPFIGFTFSGTTSTLQKEQSIEVGPTDLQGSLSFSCGPEAIIVKGDPLKIKNNRFHWFDQKISTQDFNLILKKFTVKISPDDAAVFSLPIQAALHGQIGEHKIRFQLPKGILSGEWHLSGKKNHQLSVKVDGFHLKEPQNIETKNLHLTWGNTDSTLHNYHGLFSIAGLSYIDSTKKHLVNNISTTGTYQTVAGGHRISGAITDPYKILSLKQLHIDLLTNLIRVQWPKEAAQIHLKNEITSLFPIAKEYIKTINGTLHISGTQTYKQNSLLGDLHIRGDRIYANTGYGDFSDVSFDHDIRSFTTLESQDNASLSIGEIRAGKVLKNIRFHYQMKDKNEIWGEKLHFEFDDAHFDAKNFSIHPLKKTINNFVTSIKHLNLETLLAMGIGESIKASGVLNGDATVNFVDKVPTISCDLSAEGPGWIHYRKADQIQHKAIQLTDNPMDILNGYLYNFNYKELSVDIVTNEKYKMNMTLKSLGSNPNFLKGKPLKLKVSFEQNILAALQYMMLSYELPNKLKERIEKAENK